MARRMLACPTFSSGWPLWVSRLERKKLHGSLAASFPHSDLPQKRLVIRKGERCGEAWQSAGRSEAGRIALLNNMTIVGNTASGIYNRATATMQNTIMPKNPTLSAPDCDTQLGDR